MYNSAKRSFIDFSTIFILAFILWYIYLGDSRIFSVFFGFLSLIYLLEYAFFSNANPEICSKLIYLTVIGMNLFTALMIYQGYRIFKEVEIFIRIYILILLVFYLSCILVCKNITMKNNEDCIIYKMSGSRFNFIIFLMFPVLANILLLFLLSFFKKSYSDFLIPLIMFIGIVLLTIYCYLENKDPFLPIYISIFVLLGFIVFLKS